MKEPTAVSHHPLIAGLPQESAVAASAAGKLVDPVTGRPVQPDLFARAVERAFALGVALWVVLSGAPASAAGGPRQSGTFDIVVSGYYSGSGTALANRAAVSIEADVQDDAGNAYKLRAAGLVRDPERHNLFRGKGTLGGMDVVIDGRIDAPDRRKSEVLKAGRIVFTFKVLANGRHGRGGGERTSGGSGAKPGNGGSSDGQSAAQSPGRQ